MQRHGIRVGDELDRIAVTYEMTDVRAPGGWPANRSAFGEFNATTIRTSSRLALRAASCQHRRVLDLAQERTLRDVIIRRVMRAADRAGGMLHRDELAAFDLGDGSRRRLLDASKGIWNPRDLSATLAIVSSPDSPYDDDAAVSGGLFRYAYRAGSIAGDNTKLRRAYELGLPLILFLKPRASWYVPIAPVYVVADEPAVRQVHIAVEESLRVLRDPAELTEIERRYAEVVTRARLHQSAFRGLVVRAYEVRCAVCRLQHGELLDAAHITPDSDLLGSAVVTNGLSLCKIHHAAYDRHLLGISPEYRVEINRGLLDEVDGPMLKYGLQAMHGIEITRPGRRADWPDRGRLARRFAEFAERR